MLQRKLTSAILVLMSLIILVFIVKFPNEAPTENVVLKGTLVTDQLPELLGKVVWEFKDNGKGPWSDEATDSVAIEYYFSFAVDVDGDGETDIYVYDHAQSFIDAAVSNSIASLMADLNKTHTSVKFEVLEEDEIMKSLPFIQKISDGKKVYRLIEMS